MPVYEEGDRIIVLEKSNYGNKYASMTGIVKQTFKRYGVTHYGVKLESVSNNNSSKGLFWFSPWAIKLTDNIQNFESEETFMFNNFTVATITFLDNPNSGRHFYACFNEDIKEGDTVVVKTGHHGFSLARVECLHTDDEHKDNVSCGREIVCKADFTEYNNRKAAEKRLSQLRKDMQKRIQQSQEIYLYESLAERDPVMKGMLDEFKSLLPTGNTNE